LIGKNSASVVITDPSIDFNESEFVKIVGTNFKCIQTDKRTERQKEIETEREKDRKTERQKD
jgi:hypothetical protein